MNRLAGPRDREGNVMRLVSQGVGPREIAAMLGLHKETVGRLRAQAVARLRRSIRATGLGSLGSSGLVRLSCSERPVCSGGRGRNSQRWSGRLPPRSARPAHRPRPQPDHRLAVTPKPPSDLRRYRTR